MAVRGRKTQAGRGARNGVTPAAAELLFAEDPRRDTVLLWLSDHGVPAIAEAATTVARMVGATRRFSAEEHALLDAARDALAHPPAAPGPIERIIGGADWADDSVLESLRRPCRRHRPAARRCGVPRGEGAEVGHALPRGTLSHYVPAEPAGCWALNLALLAQGAHRASLPAPPGMVSRALFRSDLDPEEIVGHLVDDARAAWHGAYSRLCLLEPELGRGREALAHLSRNARTRDAWLLVASLGACTRTQVARAFGLSRAGADIQVGALAKAGLVTLAVRGGIAWTRPQSAETPPAPLDQGSLGDAVMYLDASLRKINRLLARTASVSVQST